MASPQTAYRSSDELKSAKNAPRQPSPLSLRILRSRLPSNLRITLLSLVDASKQGPDFWASTFAVSVEAGGKEARHSYKTVQRHIDRLERLRVLKLKHQANTYVPGFGMRRTATYVLHGEAYKQLSPRESYREWQQRNRRSAPSRFRPQRVPSPAPPAPTEDAPQAAPIAPSQPPQHRSTQRIMRQLTGREGRELVAKLTQLVKGHTQVQPPEGGIAIRLDPSDRDYRAPMSPLKALRAACMILGLREEPARLYAEQCGFKFPDEAIDTS